MKTAKWLAGTWADDAVLLAMCERARAEGHDEIADHLADEVVEREIERDYETTYDGEGGGVIRATSVAEAIENAQDDVGSYGEIESTIWVDVMVRCRATGEEASATVTIDPPEPECEPGQEHDWQEPYEILGGLKESPGVWGSGGGVVMNSVCMRCGCGRTHDTWAQRHSDGVLMPSGSTSYQPGRYADEVQL